ncbi:MAG: peptidylprolyl isomerase [Candidatus Micrarchaeales archaeon]
MVFNDGDFVKIEYSAWRVADNKLIYTTSKNMAEANEMFDSEAKYVPQLIVIGKGNTIKGVEKAIMTMNLNETKKVEIEPKDAFGEKSSELVKVVSIADFKKRDIDPYPGMQIDIDGAIATIKSVNSGRVVVDANHPLAGEKMLYEIKVVGKVDKEDERVKEIVVMCSLTPDSVSVNNGEVRVLFGDKVEKDSKYLINKNDFVSSVMRYMEKVTRVSVEENYIRTKAEEKK